MSSFLEEKRILKRENSTGFMTLLPTYRRHAPTPLRRIRREAAGGREAARRREADSLEPRQPQKEGCDPHQSTWAGESREDHGAARLPAD